MSAPLTPTLSAAHPAVPDRPAHAQFDALQKELETQRQRLQAWHAFDGHYAQLMAQQWSPAQRRWNSARRNMAFAMARLLDHEPLGRQQQAKALAFLQAMAQAVLEDTPHDPELSDLLERHRPDDRQPTARKRSSAKTARPTQQPQPLQPQETAPPTDEPPAELSAEQLAEQWEQQAHAWEAEQEHRRQAGRAQAQHKRAAAAKARQQTKQTQEAQDISQSVREIYRKLASALHPDREPDPVERERKTALMQRVNQAYDARDLLTLLSLQLETEQISATTLAQAPERRLQHYNHVLTEQRDQLRAEIMAYVKRYAEPWPELTPDEHYVTPQRITQLLGRELKNLKQHTQLLEEHLANLHDWRYVEALLQWAK